MGAAARIPFFSWLSPFSSMRQPSLRVQTGKLKSSEETAADHVAFQTFFLFFFTLLICAPVCTYILHKPLKKKGGNDEISLLTALGVVSSTDANIQRTKGRRMKKSFLRLYTTNKTSTKCAQTLFFLAFSH